jgi:hypothetical protein
MVKIDDGMMYCAISDHSGSSCPEDTAYLNRHTGKIVFLFPDATDEEAADVRGVSASDVAAARRAVEDNPADWVEVPKYTRLPVYHEHWCDVRCRRDVPRDRRTCTCGARDAAPDLDEEAAAQNQFIHDFLRENGIDAEW